MQDPELAAQIDRITPEWIEALLHSSGALPETAAVRRIDLGNPLNADRGFLSRVLRVTPDYEGAPPEAPTSLIIKLPPSDKERFALGESVHAYEREIRFYSELSALIPVRVPSCYYAAVDATLGATVIVIEDAKDWQLPDQIYGLSQARVERVLSEIAGLHAHWWEAPELDELTWVPHLPWGYADNFPAAWPAFQSHYEGWLSPADRRFGDRLAEAAGAVERALARAPQTLAHCDLRADNLMLDGPGTDDEVMILDWQAVSRTMAGLDTARLVCGSLDRALPQSGYRALCGYWHRQLLARGVKGFNEAEAWRDFQAGLLFALSIPVCFHSNLSHEGARAVRLLEALTHRMFRVAEECDALACLEGL